MLQSKRSVSDKLIDKTTKKQHLDAVHWLWIDFYPKYILSCSNYGLIKKLIDENKQVYLWLSQDMIYEGIWKVKNNITEASCIMNNSSLSSSPLTIYNSSPLIINNNNPSPLTIDTPSSLTIDSDIVILTDTPSPLTIDTDIVDLTSQSITRGQPIGIMDKDKYEYEKKLADAHAKALLLWKECYNRDKNKI